MTLHNYVRRQWNEMRWQYYRFRMNHFNFGNDEKMWYYVSKYMGLSLALGKSFLFEEKVHD